MGKEKKIVAKIKVHYVCQNCGYTTLKWLGKCPECGQWDTLVEEAVVPESKASFLAVKENPRPKTLESVAIDRLERMATGIREFDRVLGGGIVPGALILIGGDPGIGYLYFFKVIKQNSYKAMLQALHPVLARVRIGTQNFRMVTI